MKNENKNLYEFGIDCVYSTDMMEAGFSPVGIRREDM
jgi:hypothetical protein